MLLELFHDTLIGYKEAPEVKHLRGDLATLPRVGREEVKKAAST